MVLSQCTSTQWTNILDHFTVVCSVTWPLNGSEAGGDLALIQTFLLLSCKCTSLALEQLYQNIRSPPGFHSKAGSPRRQL